MKLNKLLVCIEYAVIQGEGSLSETEITGISYDSRTVQQGELFVCLNGADKDGHDYMEEACKKGSKAVLIEKIGGGKKLFLPEGVIVILVKDTREALAYLSAAYFGYPARRLQVIGVTGTKGKTTVTYMLRRMLEMAGFRCGLLGTIEAWTGKTSVLMKNTTPESFTIHQYFAKMEEEGCQFVVMEVSSQGVKQKRTEGIPFKAGIFTNLGVDHVGPAEHRDFAEYKYYKSLFFEQCEIGIGNIDDPFCQEMFSKKRCRKLGYTCQGRGSEAVLAADKITFLTEKGVPMTRFRTECGTVMVSMPGMFNVYNALAALATARCLGVDPELGKLALSRIHVPGRMEWAENDKKVACYIDYAHNALSLENALATLKAYEPKRLIVVFGCGGNRSKERRAPMGEVAGRYADLTILTSDNPRMEEPERIIEDIENGIQRTSGDYVKITDRREAIRYALLMALPGDILLIAGKGHETYQEIRGKRYPMDDRELIKKAGEEECTQILS